MATAQRKTYLAFQMADMDFGRGAVHSCTLRLSNSAPGYLVTFSVEAIIHWHCHQHLGGRVRSPRLGSD